MRQFMKYNKSEIETKKIICNKCKKEIEVINGIPKEDTLRIEKRWNYFSNKDNEIHCFDICEECYDKWISSFAIPVEIE